MALPFYNWSRTATSNATADSTINWAEGQSPSSVNDSARAMMASTAAFRDDTAGAIVTGGSSTAYTVSSFQVFDTLAHLNGQMIAFTPHTTNGATVTLNVDGLGAKPLRAQPSVDLQSGVLIQGTPYLALYNNSDAAFYLFGVGSSPGIPIGSSIDYWGTSAPTTSFALAYGQAISRTTYANLFSLFSTTYGSGDGSTTFNIPDLRGRVIAGKDNMGGTSANRLGSGAGFSAGGQDPANLGAIGGVETVALTTAQLASHSHANSLTDPGHVHTPTGWQIGNAGASVGTPFVAYRIDAGSIAIPNTSSSTTGITITNASAGSGSAHNNVQPTIIANMLIRVL